MNLNQLYENDVNNTYYVSCYMREHNTVFHGKTVAVSEDKAKSNILYRIKQYSRGRWKYSESDLYERARVFTSVEDIKEYNKEFRNLKMVP